MKKLYTLAIIFSPVVMFASDLAVADSRIEDAVKFRQSGMMFMRWNMGKIKKQLGNLEALDRNQVLDSARVISAIAHSDMEKLFLPESVGVAGWKKSRLKPVYFTDSDKVKELGLAFREQADRLLDVAQHSEPQVIKRQFDNLLKSCKSCHKSYRSK